MTDEQRESDKPQSVLRGSLPDNDFDGDLHDMGGDIGPAEDTDSGEPDSGPESAGVRAAEQRAVETGAIAVDSPPPTNTGRDDPDDLAGGDTTRTLNERDPAEREIGGP